MCLSTWGSIVPLMNILGCLLSHYWLLLAYLQHPGAYFAVFNSCDGGHGAEGVSSEAKPGVIRRATTQCSAPVTNPLNTPASIKLET